MHDPIGGRRFRAPERIGRLFADVRLFSQAWLADPFRIGAVVPSGRALANLLTRDVGVHTLPIIELGPGTGCVTEALLGRGVPEHQLALIEMNGVFAAALRKRFPDARVVEADASTLGLLFHDEDRRAGAVVSGLPLISMSPESARAVLQGAFDVLRPDGVFYQFTYGLWFPVPRRTLRLLGLRAERVGWAVMNFPPASVYRVARVAAA